MSAQSNLENSYNQIDEAGNITKNNKSKTDSLGSDKEIPIGLHVWTIDSRFGDIKSAIPDTLSYSFQNTIFTSGLRGEYNTLGNLGSPRINRIFADRPITDEFIFLQPYDFFITPVEKFHFTNTLSPFTNITYNSAGNHTNGEDRFVLKFGTNVGKKLGVGFKFNYLYGRGYYNSQSTSLFDYTMYGSYLGERYQAHFLASTNHQKIAENGGISNDLYITKPSSFNDDYSTDEIPTVFEANWNRNDNQHLYFNQRYSLGFYHQVRMTPEEIKARKFAIESKKENQAQKEKDDAMNNSIKNGEYKNQEEYKAAPKFSGRPDNAKVVGAEPVSADSAFQHSERISVIGKAGVDSLLAKQKPLSAEDTSWMKKEYVPVTSFIHTLRVDKYRRIYQAYETPDNYYANTYRNIGKLPGDSIFDETKNFRIQNTFAISMLEGFNKWAKAGLKGFISHDLRHYTLPDSLGTTDSYNEHNISIGAQIVKAQGNTLHFNATGETWLIGEDAGQLRIDGSADLNFPLLGDTVTLAASGFLHRDNPSFYFRHYHSKHYYWDNEGLDKIYHTRIQGLFRYAKTNTTIRLAFDEIKDYVYLSNSYMVTNNNGTYGRANCMAEVKQCKDAITVMTLSLEQNAKIGPLNWETVLTYQKSTMQGIIPVPDLNIYTNLFLRFKIAHVLKCDFGSDLRFFTKYYAPDYVPQLGQFAVQNNESNTEVGNCPIINVYANFHLKHTRFYVMYSHVNASSGNMAYFTTPHYALNPSIFRFGLSWNFFN